MSWGKLSLREIYPTGQKSINNTVLGKVRDSGILRTDTCSCEGYIYLKVFVVFLMYIYLN